MDFKNNTKYNDQDRVQPGIYKCKIQEVYDWIKDPENKYIVISMELTKDGKTIIHKEKFSMSEKKNDPLKKSAKDVSMEKMKHLILVCAGGGALDGIQTTKDIDNALKEKEINIKFTGKEFMTKANKIGMWVNLPIFKFAEKIGDSPSKLTFNKDVDIIRLKFDGRTENGAFLNDGPKEDSSDSSNMPF